MSKKITEVGQPVPIQVPLAVIVELDKIPLFIFKVEPDVIVVPPLKVPPDPVR